MSKCFGRTKTLARCKNDAKGLFCVKHRWQPIVAILFIITTTVTLISFYHEAINPIINWLKPDEQQEESFTPVEIPIRIENGLNYETRINQSMEFYLNRTVTPAMNEVVYSGTIPIPTPDGFVRVNELIVISQGETLTTKVELPSSKIISEAFIEGGYTIQLVIRNEWIDHFYVYKEVLFYKETIRRGVILSILK